MLKCLRTKYGIETFSPWINESYDDIEDPAERMHAIFKEVERVLSMPKKEYKQFLKGINEIAKRNALKFRTIPAICTETIS